ncbi:hypothetical protein ID0563_08060 [Helicobacter pylori]
MGVCVFFFFFFLKFVKKNWHGAKKKKLYFNLEKSIKDLQKIFENTDGGDEGLRKFNQKALELFKN